MKSWLIIFSFTLSLIACDRKNYMEEKNWGVIFKNKGIDSACFELSDNSHEQIYLYNLPRVSQRLSPASTFKVFLSLVALENSVALDENLVIPWDGFVYKKTEWNKDMNMREALKTSSEPYYKELAKRIGQTELQKWMDTVNYGNKKIGDSLTRCWTNNTLQITADEQVGLMKKLYFDKLPFSTRTQRIVKSLMLQEDTDAYKLYYKTGTFVKEDDTYLTWLVGFLERKETQKNIETKNLETNFKPYFFAMNYDTASDSIMKPSYRVAILKEILASKGIIR